MTADDPIELAKAYTNRLVDLVIAAHAANENTRQVVYSPHLARQIPPSCAGHAFKQLQDTLLFYSVVRACALFDKASNDRISLHMVVWWLDASTVRNIAPDTYRYHASINEPRRLTPETDPDVERLLREHWEQYRKERGRREGRLVCRRVRLAGKVVDRADRLFIKDHLRPFRDNFLAQNDGHTDADRPLIPMIGDEKFADI